MLVLQLRETVGWFYVEEQTEIFGKKTFIRRNRIVCALKKKSLFFEHVQV